MEVLSYLKRFNGKTIFKREKKTTQGTTGCPSLISDPERNIEPLLLEVTSKHIKDKEGLGTVSINLQRANHM